MLFRLILVSVKIIIFFLYNIMDHVDAIMPSSL